MERMRKLIQRLLAFDERGVTFRWKAPIPILPRVPPSSAATVAHR